LQTEIKSEIEYIIEQWQANFACMNEQKMVIYGIGKNTKTILDCFAAENIVGLMDEARTGENIYDKPILSAEQVVEAGVTTIVIVARASNVRIIYRRIADICSANQIAVYDITGNLACQENANEKSFQQYEAISKQCLQAKIDCADVVSFDVFDTLLMRRVLYPRDIFVLLEKEFGKEFSKMRINVEMELYREGKNPTLYEIYARIPGSSPASEIALEAEYLIQRKSMVSMFQYARSAGKEVYLVSDMYLPNDLIYQFFYGLGIDIEKKNILVSCDYGVSKSTGLFDVLREKVGTKRILHIGDSLEADIESAKKYNIEDTFHIKNALEMLEDGYASDILRYDTTLPNRMMIGSFVSEQLNDPFLFNQTKGKFLLNGAYEMGYSLIAPLVYCFFGWLVSKAQELQLDCVLLSARDGFILSKIHDMCKISAEDLPPMLYFYSSRAASVLASLMDDDDILHAARLAYAGKTEDMLRNRFHLTEEELRSPAEGGGLSGTENVLRYREAILRHADAARRQYEAYIQTLNIPAGAKVGFFDFVSSGTCQKALANFVNFDLVGLFFAALNVEMEYKPDTKIESMFGISNVFESEASRRFSLVDNYIFLENIITSCESTLRGFDDEGMPLFVSERRTEKQLRALQEIHKSILDYVQESGITLDVVKEIDARVPDFFLKLTKKQYSNINTDYFDIEQLTDEFANRIFTLSDMI